MINFAFLPNCFSDIAADASQAEGHIHSDPRAACFHARFVLEAALHWLYRFEGRLNQPYDRNLAVTQSSFPFKSQNFLDFTHG